MRRCLLALVLLLHAAPVFAQLQKVETGDMRLVYISPSETFLVPHAGRTFMSSVTFLKTLFDYTPSEKITVLLTDFSDAGNAGATSVPHDTLRVQIAPLSFTFETIVASERMNTIMSHETVHVIAMDQAAGRDRFFRGFFGGKVLPIAEQPETVLYFYLTTPRVAAPRWFHEGGAVFVDTWMAGGIGRAQGGYDEMVFRAMVKDHAPFYDPLGLASEGTKIDFQTEVNSYLYGTRFITWLGYHYTPAQVIQWLGRKPGSKAYYASQFQLVFGMPLEKAWAEWVQFEHTFQQANLDAIRKYPITPYKDLSPRALGSVSRAHYDSASHTIYAAFNYPGVVAHVGTISTDTGATTHLTDIKGPLIYQVTSLAIDPAGPTLFYTTDNLAYRDLVALDVKTGTRRVLMKDARIGDLVFSRADRTLWGIRHLNGLCTLVSLAPPYNDWKQAVTFPYGTIVYDLDVSPDGSLLAASFGEINGKQNVRVISIAKLRAGDATPDYDFDFGPSVPDSFVFSPDGKFLYGSSYYTGASNIFRYELATKKIEAVSNAETGFFRPIPLGGDELIVFRYTGQGWVPARITARRFRTSTRSRSSASRRSRSTRSSRPGPRRRAPRSTTTRCPRPRAPTGWAATSCASRSTRSSRATRTPPPSACGTTCPIRSASTARISPRRTRRTAICPTTSACICARSIERYDWDLLASYNDADFYDLFGPTKVSRKGYSIGLGHTNTLIFDEPRRMTLEVKGRVAGNLDQLPQYQNVPVKVDQLISAGAKLTSSYLRSSLGHVDDEKGRLWTTALEADYVNSQAFARMYATYDVGLAVPLPHSSFWVRSAAGFSPQNRTEPFANFFFGGFGNNYVDHGETKRYREYYSFPARSSTRSAAATSRGRCSSGTCRRGASSARARRART